MTWNLFFPLQLSVVLDLSTVLTSFTANRFHSSTLLSHIPPTVLYISSSLSSSPKMWCCLPVKHSSSLMTSVRWKIHTCQLFTSSAQDTLLHFWPFSSDIGREWCHFAWIRVSKHFTCDASHHRQKKTSKAPPLAKQGVWGTWKVSWFNNLFYKHW